MRLEDKIKIPLIQGGMGVGISLSHLAGAVAREGAIGTLSSADIGFKKEDFYKNSKRDNYIALEEEVKKAREISENKGLLAMNIMCAMNDYENIVKESIKAGIDIIISGAGLPLNLAEITRDEDILIAPIVSSLRALKIILKRWKNVDRIPDFIVIEGPLAGGHLGFKDVENSQSLEEIVEEVAEYLKENKLDIKIFAAGGIRTKEEVKILREKGAYGIQVATPFIATEECDAHIDFKMEIINSIEDDLEIIKSPVGMPARAIKNSFLKDIYNENINPRNINCINCIKTCDGKTMKYCITEYLIKSAEGKSGLVFSGAKIDGIDKIRNVKDVIGDYF